MGQYQMDFQCYKMVITHDLINALMFEKQLQE